MFKNRAFTLVELVIVIILIGILSAIALPKYNNLNEDAEFAHYQNIYHQFIAGIEQSSLKYVVNKRKAYIDYNGDTVNDLYFRDKIPYPIGSELEGHRYRIDAMSAGLSEGNQACGAIFQQLLNTDYTVETFGAPCYESKNHVCTISFYDAKGFGCYYLFTTGDPLDPMYGFSYFVDFGEPYFFLFKAPKESIEWWAPDFVASQGDQSYILEKTGKYENLFMNQVQLGLDSLSNYYGTNEDGNSKLGDLSQKIADSLTDEQLAKIIETVSKNSAARYKADIAEALGASPSDISDEWANSLYESHNFLLNGAKNIKDSANKQSNPN